MRVGLTMHRTLALAALLSLAALLLPAGISSSARSAAGSKVSIALLDRSAVASDQLPPAVARAIDTTEVDTSTTRLGATSGSVQYFVAQGRRGICLIRVDDPVAPAFAATCASTLIAGGVYLASLDRAAGTMQVADVVPDDVKQATVDGAGVGVTNNLVVTGDVPLQASLAVIGATGAAQRVPITISASVLPGG
jgi:hypothetical protein